MTTFSFRQIEANATTEVVAGRFADALRKYIDVRRAELNKQFAGVKAVNTIRAEEDANGKYECNGFRFALKVTFFTPSKPVDQVAVMDERGEAAMKRGYGHY